MAEMLIMSISLLALITAFADISTAGVTPVKVHPRNALWNSIKNSIDGDGNAKQTDVLGQSLRDFKEYIAPKRSPMVKRKVIRRQVTQTGGEGDHATLGRKTMKV